MAVVSAVEWSFRPVLRPVHLAGRTLFRVPVPLYVCESHFSALPDDPVIGVVFICMAAVCGAIAFFVNRKKDAAQPSGS